MFDGDFTRTNLDSDNPDQINWALLPSGVGGVWEEVSTSPQEERTPQQGVMFDLVNTGSEQGGINHVSLFPGFSLPAALSAIHPSPVLLLHSFSRLDLYLSESLPLSQLLQLL